MTDMNAFKPVEAADMGFSFPVAYGHYQDTFQILSATELEVRRITAERDTLSRDLATRTTQYEALMNTAQVVADDRNQMRYGIRDYFQNLVNEMDDPENDEFDIDMDDINSLFDSLNIAPLEVPKKLFRVELEPADVRVTVTVYAKDEDEAEAIVERLGWTIEPYAHYGEDFEDCDAEIDFNVYSVNRVDLS